MKKEEKQEIKSALLQLFEETFKEKGYCEEMKGGGSNRRYFRLSSPNNNVIGVYCDDLKENIDFINLSECLKASGIRVPSIINEDMERGIYLEEDLGNISLLDELESLQIKDPEKKMELAKKALSELIRIQTIPESKWKDKVGYSPFGKRLVKWDLNYFKYDFLKPAGIKFDEEQLENDFENLEREITESNFEEGLMYRDYQSRNIMMKDGELYFIDYQGARKGPLSYDAVSFIWQAKAPFSYEEREELSEYYIRELVKKGKDGTQIRRQMEILEVFRTLQVLGAYGFRGLIEKKSHFMESLPKGIRNLSYLREKGRLDKYPEIKKISSVLSPEEFERETISDVLTVQVSSFSYKKGYPEDKSGNGGGYVFDCRALPNPGRYREYQNSTGRDKDVIEFLERKGEVEEFINKTIAIVRPSIEKYIERKFTSLHIGFGCTGGQHRSVYCAEKMADKIKGLYPQVRVVKLHREQNIKEEMA